ncbi:cell division protein ZapE [Alkalimonas sp. NCh-2]|uniref:cell division protein ZapE n=1 Tax=Alkalimonas sp. NCh-2 TaxID=3144846 RepID=UPI0031F63809
MLRNSISGLSQRTRSNCHSNSLAGKKERITILLQQYLLEHYQQQVAAQQLHYDEHQYQVLKLLQRLANQLNSPSGQTPRGLYIQGPVGRGKTMLMDLFYQHLQTTSKTRLHFHHFMARVHTELNQLSGQTDPLQRIARQWARQYRVLCFDEFFVNDIADAMLLGTLWQHLFAAGVVLVTTSNALPEELYANGLQRQRFLPTIALLQRYCEVVRVNSAQDYRLLSGNAWQHYLLAASAEQLKQHAEQLTGPVLPLPSIRILNRDIPALWHNEQVIGFDFNALCAGPRSQLDYMALLDQYPIIAVHQVPQFSYLADKPIVHGVEDSYQREHRDYYVSKLDNEARRFIALVDECYDRGKLLLLTAEVPPTELYQAKQLAFAFARCSSRLFEMQSWRPETTRA